jgi:hypothetical protein
VFVVHYKGGRGSPSSSFFNLIARPPYPSSERYYKKTLLHVLSTPVEGCSFFPTLASTPVMITSPTRNEIPAATRLPTRTERHPLGESGRFGKYKTLDNNALNLPRMPRR